MRIILKVLIWLIAIFLAVLTSLGLGALYPMPSWGLFLVGCFFGALYSLVASYVSDEILKI